MFSLNFNETTQNIFDQFYFYTKQGSRNELVEITPKEVNFPIYLRRSTSDIENFIQIFLRQEYSFLPFTPKTIVDLGGYIGLSSIYLASKYPESKIILVEPDPDNFILASLNCRPYSNIECLNVAVWSENCNLMIYDKVDGDWGTMIKKSSENEEHSSIIKSMTVNDIFNYSNFEEVDFLKIDIEGSEKVIFDNYGNSTWIDKCKVVSCEFHDHMIPGCKESFDNVINSKKFQHNTYGEFDFYVNMSSNCKENNDINNFTFYSKY